MAKKHAEKHEEETITVSKTAIWQGLTAVFAILFVASLLTGGFGMGPKAAPTGGTGGTPTDPAAGTGAAPTGPVEVNLEGAHSLGAEDAPVVLIEWSDYQCGFCQRFKMETEPQIIKNYVETGKVRFVYKHFPLDSIHPQATPAALASECAGEQGKFWEYNDKIFANTQSLNTANYRLWAKDLGLNEGMFNTCLDTQKYLDRVKSDMQEGLAAGVRGTPGFLLNGKLISGAQPYAVFQAEIEAALN